MKTIEIDSEVLEYIENKVSSFNQSPNDVLRRLFGLNPDTSGKTPTDPPIRKIRMGRIDNNLVGKKIKRRPRTRLSELVKAKMLAEGQPLYLYLDEDVEPSCEAIIMGDHLNWNGDKYSMSDLALRFINQAGRSWKAAPGPNFWYVGTENDDLSIAELWKKYLNKQGVK